MSWQELERLVDDVETDDVIRRAMKCCRSRHEFVLAARRLGYRITRIDLRFCISERIRKPGACMPNGGKTSVYGG